MGAAWGRGRSFRGWGRCGGCLTCIGESLGFVLGFRVGPRTNILVGNKGSGKKRSKQAEKWAAVRKWTWPRQGIEPKS
jgi:hypothetical protein